MLELAAELLPRLRAGVRIAAVTVTGVARSAPRTVGASMAVTEAGEVIGSISGGCVEGDAVLLALEAIATGSGRSARFGFSDEAAYAAGLACGGTIEVVAYPVSADDGTALAALEGAARDEPVSVELVVDGAYLGRLVPSGQTTDAATLTLTHAPRPRLLVLGAGDYAAALCRAATVAGFAVTVCDAWGLLVTPERFPEADRLVTALPHEYLREESARLDARSVICVLTHDERLDVPALREALRLPVAFVGALGARPTVTRRAALLRQAGVTDAELDRLHSPLGLDLGASTPDETAVAILAEIIAARHRRTGLPLRDLTGPLHSGGTRADGSVVADAGNCAVTPAPVATEAAVGAVAVGAAAGVATGAVDAAARGAARATTVRP